MLFPLNLIPNIVLCPKYSIRKYFITPNPMLVQVVGFFVTFIYAACYAYRAYDGYTDKLLKIYFPALYMNCFFDALFYFYGFLMNFVVSVIQSKFNIEFVLNYQEIHVFFVTRNYFRNFILWNWISIIFVVVWYICMVSFSLITGASIYVCFNDLIMIIIDANIIYVTRLLKLLNEKINLMNLEIQSLKSFNVGEENCKKLFKAYCDIIKCYDMIVVSYQQYVSCITVFIFEGSLKLLLLILII